MNSATGTKKTVGFGKALVVFICVFVLILCGINVLGTSAHIPLVIATIVATIAGVSSGFTWDEMEKGMSETIKASAPAILIMLIIGMVVGTWMLGGIIPTMIYYGLTWLSPKIFLFAACALCVMVSTFTGSSWTTMGTVGVALVGVGTALQVPLGMTVGAIISGAYFGDKMSPLSDTTNLAPAMAGTTVFTHVKHMVVTAGPSIIISLIIYAIMGFTVVKGTASMETVVLLSHKKADSYIHIDVEFGEGEGKIPVDSIAKRAEAYKPKEKVTYKMIKEYIEAKYGFKVHTAYIAEVKRDLGLPMYDAPNAVEELKQPRKHPTPEKVEAIKDALRYFAVI